jgi:uncharacterized membrane protein
MSPPQDDPARPDPAQPQSIADEVRRLYASARDRAETELAFRKAQASLAGKLASVAAAVGCAALVFLFFALMAAVFGLVLALSEIVGAWAATGIVAGGFALLAVIAGLLAWSRVRRIVALLRGNGE